jgi:hypothetical protein
MSYAVGTDELSVAKIEGYRQLAKDKLTKEAIKQGFATDINGLVFREAIPNIDMGPTPAGTGYAQATYVTGAIAVNTWTSVFSNAAVPQMANNRILAIYKIYNESPLPNIAEVRFRLGQTGTSTLGWFHLEGILNVKRTPEAWLSEPVIYMPSQWMFIECIARVAVPAAGERLGFGAFVCERVGEQLS